MKKLHKLKLNNDGSSIVFVVVTIVFIGLLASLILALSLAGFRMRTIDYHSRQNFYEGEEYSGKIYAEFGMNAVGILGEAYVSTMGKLNTQSITSENALNNYLKRLYYKNMLTYLKLAAPGISDTALTVPFEFAEGSAEVLDMETRIQNIVDPTMADVEAKVKGKIQCNLEGGTFDDGTKYPLITINDVHLKYINVDNNFQSDYTFDIVIRYPEWDFTFSNPVSASTDFDTFLDYVLISNDVISFDGVNETVYGCVATGTNGAVAINDNTAIGLQVNSGSDVRFYRNEANWYEKSAIVVTDNVMVNSSVTSPSYLELNGGKLWCNSVLLNRETSEVNSTGSTFITNSEILYMQDDLQLDGDCSRAVVNGGSYFGYSSNMSDGSNAQNSSSAIMVNGNNSSLNLQNLDSLCVNGLAYINFKNRGTLYRTGESLSVKGNQDIYLVPDEYMYVNASKTTANPIRQGGAYTLQPDLVKAALTTSFFGKDYLNKTEPYITRNYTINGNEYTFYYLNFESPSAQGQYVTTVLNSTSTDPVLLAIRKRIKENLADMNMDDAAILSASATSTFTAGAIVTASGGASWENASASATAGNVAGIVIDSMNYRNRYLLMKSMLMPVVDGEIVNDFANVHCIDLVQKHADDPTAYPSEYRAIVNQYLNNSAVSNIIDTTKLNLYVSDSGGQWSRSYSALGATLKYVSVPGGGVYNVEETKGVVVVDGSANVTKSFEGLIVATGGITVTGSGTLTSNPELVDKVLTTEQGYTPTGSEPGPRSDVFRYYPVNTPLTAYGDSIEQLQYSDVLYYDNWRKY